tara:strand:+ start:47 stop:1087 length:1041 start_codon:yes stop_codon:yes gene_type:complete
MNDSKTKTILITGSAGFIGFHLASLLLESNWRVIGLDAITDYYDTGLKKDRHNILSKNKNFVPVEDCLQSEKAIANIFSTYRPEVIIHLAAQAGVRYSIDSPKSYVDANLVGTFNVLEAARNNQIKHLLFASTSSVYGSNKEMPFHELQKSDNQMSFYAATKKANEVMLHSYSHIFNIPTTIFRFFTVYGPWGRPDMALFKFTKAIIKNQSIDVYNYGKMKRDFTYVADLVKAIELLIKEIPEQPSLRSDSRSIKVDSISDVAPYRIVNIGNSNPTNLMDYISALEKALKKEAKKNFLAIQPGDVPATWANTTLLKDLTGFTPSTSVEDGVKKFVSWYLDYYKNDL